MQGKISQIMGAVVDVEFSDGNLPKIMNALKIESHNVRFVVKAKEKICHCHARVSSILPRSYLTSV